MASSASMPATRLSPARISNDIECAKYSARLTNPNTIQITTIKTDPRSTVEWNVSFRLTPALSLEEREQRSPRGDESIATKSLFALLSFIVQFQWFAVFGWCAPERRLAPRVQSARSWTRRGRFAAARVESEP